MVLSTTWHTVDAAGRTSECGRDSEEPVIAGCSLSPRVQVSSVGLQCNGVKEVKTFKRWGLMGNDESILA